MRIKRYEDLTMKGAIDRVREDLGPEAVILSTRKVDQGKGAFGLLGRKIVEVTAAIDREPTAEIPPVEDRGDMKEAISLLRSEIGSLRERVNRQISLQQGFSPDVDELRYLARYLKKQVDLAGMASPFRPESISLYQRLIDQGVSASHAKKIIASTEKQLTKWKGKGGDLFPKKVCLAVINQMIGVSEPIQFEKSSPKLVSLMGPTGVGKTTTIAKLAAHFAIREKKRVCLITMDTYRIAAVEQLKTYANIIGLPLEVVLFKNRLPSVLNRFEAYDLMLIDTAGRSQNNQEQMDELNGLINQGIPIEKHLVVSATTKPSDLNEIARKFGPIGFDRILFTKLDESYSFGSILTLSLDAQKPLSYITFGQRVPEDICVANVRLLGELTLGLGQKENRIHSGNPGPVA
jgi:flagellar biosynthesis protein FlhF